MLNVLDPLTLVLLKYTDKTFIEDTEIFEKRLQMDNHTGSLTIRNIRSEHTGLYKVQIIGRGTSYKRFSVTVYGE